MKIDNLPNKKHVTVTVIPTGVEKCNDILTRFFSLASVQFSLEEVTSIEGFLGWVHCIDGKNVLGQCPVAYNVKGLPTPVVAVCFQKPKQ